MKLTKLEVSAIRSPGEKGRVTSLSSRELRSIVGVAGDPCGEVPPEICAIHDYYICDVVE